jgi:hypothetical protein
LVYDVFGSFQDAESSFQGKCNIKMLRDPSTEWDAMPLSLEPKSIVQVDAEFRTDIAQVVGISNISKLIR